VAKLRIVQVVLSATICSIMLGCASIMHGTSQQIGIGSTPSGARVTVGGQSFGSTPVLANLKRGDSHIVKIELDGYFPYETTLTRRVSGWVWGNLLFGGLIGLAVDAISGGIYNLTPEQIQATMAHDKNAQNQFPRDSLYVFVTLEPDPSWTKIGQLAKAY